ncbi:MAG TPA: efflux RND transporter periplasmic adaptor subunit [Mycobacteriales bacterium]|nr:efflux RND transporter periplasmic adaptor subunit [Mycobacteriales bacterium]
MRLPRKGATAAVAVSAALLTGCSGDSSDIQTAAVGRSTVSEVVEAPATVQAAATTTLTSPATGEIQQVLVKDGQRVAAGTLLARISSPQTESQLTQARSALAQVSSGQSAPALLSAGPQTQADATAQAAFASARTAAAAIADPRLKAIALTQIATAEHQYQLAAAQARAAIGAINSGIGNLTSALASLTAAQRLQAQAAVQVAQRAVDALEVTAPIAGTVQLGGETPAGAGSSGTDLSGVLSQLPASAQQQAATALGGAATSGGGAGVQTTGPLTVGTPVSTGTTLATIVDVSTLSLQADVDETDVFLVRPGVRAEAQLDAVPGATYPATVASVGLSPTQSARGGVSYRARLTLGAGTMPDGSPAPTPRPGMSAVADLQVRTARNAVSVPATAIVHDGDRDAVWVVQGTLARRRTVTVGAQGENVVAVTEGLKVGERVVVRGTDQVREGQELS